MLINFNYHQSSDLYASGFVIKDDFGNYRRAKRDVIYF